MSEIILASASPRRKEILDNLGIKCTVIPADIDESALSGEEPREFVTRLAMAKALAVAKDVTEGLVIACDTIVTIDGMILGKPTDKEDAYDMLKKLKGRDHVVITALGIVDKPSGKTMDSREETIVHMRDYSDEDIESYIANDEPYDKAGGYGIQGIGSLLVRGISGDYFNVVGLPIGKLSEMTKFFGIDLLKLV